MASLVLDGETLGERYQHYNKILREAIAKNNSQEPDKINPQTSDIENILKIDIASHNRNLDYIIDVFKSNDALYATRAIYKSTWLITDQEYSRIVNPEYLNSKLYPKMIAKASKMLKLKIRTHLKDEERAEKFFKFYKEVDMKQAFKWLPKCSVKFIVNIVSEKYLKLDLKITKQIFTKSILIFEAMIRQRTKNNLYVGDIYFLFPFLFNNHTERLLDLAESTNQLTCFNEKRTAIIMKKFPERILNKLDYYKHRISISTMAKYLKNVNAFVLDRINENELRPWLLHRTRIIDQMPKHERFEFVKQVFIDKTIKSGNGCDIVKESNAKIYCWYEYAPFDVAFTEFRKIIRSMPDQKSDFFKTLLKSANGEIENIKTVLQYHQDHYINGTFDEKLTFVGDVFDNSKTTEYDEETWNILDRLFHSLQIYDEYVATSKNVQNIIMTIIIYNVLHGKKVPKLIENKFIFNTLLETRKNLNKENQENLFHYLHNISSNKILNCLIVDEEKFKESIDITKNYFRLLLDWAKDIKDYPLAITQLKHLIQIMKENSWKADMNIFYNMKKSWKKYMYEENVIQRSFEERCMNALKLNPEILAEYQNEAILDYAYPLRRFLSKIRIYWPSIANNWLAFYLDKVENTGDSKTVITGICSLMPSYLALDIIAEYLPVQINLNEGTGESTEKVRGLRKNIGINLRWLRPPLRMGQILKLGRDNLQYAMPSINWLLYNMNTTDSFELLVNCKDAPNSLKKQFIRRLSSKLDQNELKLVFSDLLKNNTDVEIQKLIFKSAFEVIKQTNTDSSAIEIWKIFDIFLEDNEHNDAAKIIYELFGKSESVPAIIRPMYFMKKINYLKSMPDKKREFLAEIDSSLFFMESLDSDFAGDIMLETVNKNFAVNRFNNGKCLHVVISYLLSVFDEETQIRRFNKVFVPITETASANWFDEIKANCVRENMNDLLRDLCRDFMIYSISKKMIVPTKLFKSILSQMETIFPIIEDYTILRSWKIATAFIELLDEQKTVICESSIQDADRYNLSWKIRKDSFWTELCLKVTPQLGVICLEYLKDDILNFHESIDTLFADATQQMFEWFDFSELIKLDILRNLLNEDVKQSYFVVHRILPDFLTERDKKLREEIIAKLSNHDSVEVKMLSTQIIIAEILFDPEDSHSDIF